MGFTLIELLIVVAIIAILAAIAVPNFMEAQVRAKVGRVKSDLRTIATGMESYIIDNKKYPRDPFEMATYDLRTLKYWSQLTTPLAYMTSIVWDPFRDNRREGSYIGVNFNYYIPHTSDLYKTGWRSSGNAPDVDYIRNVYEKGTDAYDNYSVGPDGIHFSPAGPQGQVIAGSLEFTPYDPSNGTVSAGNILRNNRGYRMN